MGDINLYRTVDLLDINLLGPNWQKAKDQWSQGDLNGDGVVDLLDINLLGPNWQKTFTPASPAPAAAPPVPEPATMSLLCLGAVGLLRRRRR